jgi:hypothetical protein
MSSNIPDSLFHQAQSCLTPKQSLLIGDVKRILDCLQEKDHISDYSFLVAPAAKAYEGYLKDFFLKSHIINKDAYHSDRFRVGKTLNPSLRYKRFSIFHRLANLHEKGEELAECLWDAWKFGRNEIFHYFPDSMRNLNRYEAEDRIKLILEAITKSSQFLKDLQRDIPSVYDAPNPDSYSNNF